MSKKYVSALALSALMLTSVAGVQAARSIDGYDTVVPVISDYESSLLVKDNTSSAVNNVSSLANGLVSWVENSGGSNITDKASYDTSGRKIMNYSNASGWVEKPVKLNISTPSNVWSNTATKGTWSPDER